MAAAARPQAELDAKLQSDSDKGAVVHTFNPYSSPEEKGRAAGKGAHNLDSVMSNGRSTGAQEVHIEKPGPHVIPTITVEDADSNGRSITASGTNQSAKAVQEEASANLPGAMPPGPAPVIPDWYRIGWRQVSGIDDPPLAEGEEKDKGVLDMFLSEQYYGAWYHNAALVFFAVIASHYLTLFRFGWGWLFIVLAFCSTYHTTSMARHRRYVRDDIQRELVKTRLASENESADWINHFLDRFWPIYEPVLSKTITQSVDQVLSYSTPAFLDSLRLSHFTLGNKAPRIDQVRTHPKTDDDVVMMDWSISFTPTDLTDVTPRQKDKKVNPKIVLAVRLGRGLATAVMPILVEDISFSGKMRIRLKLMSNFPHVQLVDLCFMEKPVIDYVLKPIGGESFGFDIANVPGLSSFIREMTHSTLGPMMYDPNVFTLNLEQLLSGKPLDTAIGVLKITVQSARGIKGTKIGGGTPDPFVSISISNRAELARTKYKPNTYNPTWMETKFILINSLHEPLTLSVIDFNDLRKHSLLSSASFDLTKLADDSTQEGIVSPLLKDGKVRGELRYDVVFHPVLEAEDGKEEIQDTTVGIVRLTIHQAKDLDSSKSLSGDLNPMAKLYNGTDSNHMHVTPIFKRTLSPVWESAHEYLCTDKNSAVITVKVVDDRDFLKDPVIGYMSIKLTDLLDAKNEAGRDWYPLSNCKSGKLRISGEWKPLSMAGSLHGSDQYKPPIGVVRVHLDKATDVKNVEATLGGKSDPYVRVQVQNVTKGRTEVVNNNLNPVWDQIVYIPVHSLKENLLLECMDYQNLTRDRSLGSVELHVSDLATEEPNDLEYPYKSTGIKSVADPIQLDQGNVFKGQLHYTAEFIPALALKGVHFNRESNELQKLSNTSEDGHTVSSHSDSEYQDVPAGITINSSDDHKKAAANAPHTAETNGNSKTSDSENLSIVNGNGSVNGKEVEKGVEMGIDELLTHQSGIIVFDIISGELMKKARLEVLLDDGYWPLFSTVRARSTHVQWDYVGEGFIKEVDFGRVWLRLNESNDGEKDDVVAEWKGDAKTFLKGTLTGPQKFTLTDNEDKSMASVMIEARYVPVPVTLEARESVNNQGILRVSVIDGHEIRGVDRGGKSDPYAVFTLNGQKVFKSHTVKKTLNPVWNENFEVSVPSRVAADFMLEIFDWNQIEQAKSLGTGRIELSDLEPFQASERTISLISAKHGEKGTVRLGFMFQPEIIIRSRKNTSTFSTAGRAMTTIGGLPVSAGKGVFQGVASGVATIFKKGDRDREKNEGEPFTAPSGQASQPVKLSENMDGNPIAAGRVDNDHIQGEVGALRVTVLNAKDLSAHDSKPYVTIRVGDKEYKTKHTAKTAVPEWNESFVFTAGPHTAKLYAWIHDHKTLSKDKDIGDGEVDIWRHIQPAGVSNADVFLELRRGGLLRLRLEFEAGVKPLGSGSSISSGEHMSRTRSIPSPSRFSIRGRRPGAAESEEQ